MCFSTRYTSITHMLGCHTLIRLLLQTAHPVRAFRCGLRSGVLETITRSWLLMIALEKLSNGMCEFGKLKRGTRQCDMTAL